MTAATIGGLLVWGTLVGLDLASVAQVMISRPLVAAVGAGFIVGDVNTGLMVGVILELFALDVLPFGAARYPDYGLGAVAAVATATGAPGMFGVGIGVAVGLVMAYAGERGVLFVRRRTSLDVRSNSAAVDAGDVRAIYRLHLRGIARDAARALFLTGVGLLLAGAVRFVPPVTVRSAVLLSAVAVGVGLGTGFVGGLRMAKGGSGGWTWLAGGLLVGIAWVVIS